MRAADLVFSAAGAAGIRYSFVNPGTTEMPLVEAFDRIKGVRPVLCPFEGVATGAADGYARMAGVPGLTVLHLGPGYANGMANLHNARRARSPVINIIGEHTTAHRPFDPPLAMPIEALAAALPGHVRTVLEGADAGTAFAECYGAATRGLISHLVFAHDLQSAEVEGDLSVLSAARRETVPLETVAAVARTLNRAAKPALLLGGQALGGEGLRLAGQVGQACGADLFHETFAARIERGAGMPSPIRLPYFPESARDALKPYDVVVLVGAPSPVGFFGYPGVSGRLVEEARENTLCRPEADVGRSLQDLADALGITPASPLCPVPEYRLPDLPKGPLTLETLGQAFAALQPEEAVVVDEGITSGFFYHPLAANVSPHTTLTITGGAIGCGIPMSIGAALACPDRPVLTLQADGSALFTVQGLWTQARENLNIKTVICSNKSYDILKLEVARAGNTDPGPMTRSLTDLSRPDIGWTEIARGFGVPALSVRTAEAFVAALQTALKEPGPFLVEAVLG
ncbi:acetolactate synthase large subunit [Desulfoluna butyratoxydans]|uniref:Thiamin diphosphate-binding fold n=1 Tax=Desulfoluna butyratoxydans TaxID=231438 RepID=A0A4U8YQQ6_9BACT|nr:acetolactate synthase large subunit [Desulfoluna butyratoxydans]VFQ46635.1 thiamin diphosphate-binding fold [Desulfoluna butyratoxydans]